MTRPGPVNLLQEYAVARFSQRKSVVPAVTCFSGSLYPLAHSFEPYGKTGLADTGDDSRADLSLRAGLCSRLSAGL